MLRPHFLRRFLLLLQGPTAYTRRTGHIATSLSVNGNTVLIRPVRGIFRTAHCSVVRENHVIAADSNSETLDCDPLADNRIIYNCVLNSDVRKREYLNKTIHRSNERKTVSSVFLKCVSGSIPSRAEPELPQPDQSSAPLSFPYSESEMFPVNMSGSNSADSTTCSGESEPSLATSQCSGENLTSSRQQILRRIRALRARCLREDFCGSAEEAALEREELWVLQYGSEDPADATTMSGAVCGGCGAVLQCRRSGWPGFVPVELMRTLSADQLARLTCQRCYFLRHHHTPLHVTVSGATYETMMAQVGRRRCLVLLLIDLLDFPGSIWPRLPQLIGSKNPVMVVGNKVDLLPQDGDRFLAGVERCLLSQLDSVIGGGGSGGSSGGGGGAGSGGGGGAGSGGGGGDSGLNIQRVHLISAKTGYGVEDLISDVQLNWRNGDIYLMGATNAGKSSLFNALLQSDMCRSAEYDLIQRATVSQWPGTTLNLLKFPLLRPLAYHLKKRKRRLEVEQTQVWKEEVLRRQRMRENPRPCYAMLSGRISRTFHGVEPLNGEATVLDRNTLNEKERGVCSGESDVNTHWLFDTPGCVTDKQLLDLLTQEELLLTLSRDLIAARTVTLRLGQSVFLGGLARMDYTAGTDTCRLTVFASKHLPITVVATVDASAIYSQYLASELFVVPRGGAERMARWPRLQPVQCDVPLADNDRRSQRGCDKQRETSVADIVLSTAGWVAVTPVTGLPGGGGGGSGGGVADSLSYIVHSVLPSGVCVRRPALLPRAVRLRGRRLFNSPAHGPHSLYIPPLLQPLH